MQIIWVVYNGIDCTNYDKYMDYGEYIDYGEYPPYPPYIGYNGCIDY